MVTNKEFKEFKKDTKFYVILMAITMILWIITISFFSHQNTKNIEQIKCALGIKDCPTASGILTQNTFETEGFEAECVENKTITHKRKNQVYDIFVDICLKNIAIHSQFESFNDCINYVELNFGISKFSYDYETICTKETLTRRIT